MSDKEILNQCGFYEEIEEGDGCLFDRYVLELASGIKLFGLLARLVVP